MGNKTNIQWCDSTVNPTTGCDGCELFAIGTGGPCYAGNLHEGRMALAMPKLYAPSFFEVRLAPGRMAQAAASSDLAGKPRPGKPWLDGMPRVIFLGDMADVFSEAVPFDYLKAEVIDNVTSAKGRRHVWMMLTKRPSRMARFAEWLRREHGIEWPSNLWPGTSITNARNRKGRMDELLLIPSDRRFLSVEPMTGWIDPERLVDPHISLIIVGGESRQPGFEPRPFDLEWAREIAAECHDAEIACFVKQLGSHPIGSYHERMRMIGESVGDVDSIVRWKLSDSHGGDWSEWPEDLRVRQMPRSEVDHA